MQYFRLFICNILFMLYIIIEGSHAITRDVHGRDRTCSNLTRKVRTCSNLFELSELFDLAELFEQVQTGSNAGNYKNHAPRVRAVVRRSKQT